MQQQPKPIEELTFEKVEEFIKSSSFKFKPEQAKISYPIITRIHRRYIEGARYSEIKVSGDGVISDGHHRFISLTLLNANIQTIPAGENSKKINKLTWKDVILDKTDYDSWSLKRHYEKEYDELKC